MRDYDSSIGRYVQSDPVGLDAGLNTYLYALANPHVYFDPYGARFRSMNDVMNLHRTMEHINDPRPYWRPPNSKLPYKCSCPIPSMDDIARNSPQMCDRNFGKPPQMRSSMCSCE